MSRKKLPPEELKTNKRRYRAAWVAQNWTSNNPYLTRDLANLDDNSDKRTRGENRARFNLGDGASWKFSKHISE